MTPHPTVVIEIASGIRTAAGMLNGSAFAKQRPANTLTVLGRGSELTGTAYGEGSHEIVILSLLPAVGERFPEFPMIDLRPSANAVDDAMHQAGRQLAAAMHWRDVFLLEAICCRISERLLTSFGFLSGRHVPHAVRLTPRQLRTILDYVESDASADVSIHTLARLCGLSDNYFIRAFRETLHLTPHQYVLRKRLQRSMQLLSGSALSLAQIADLTGFSSQSHFTGKFRCFTGETPSRYRKRLSTGRKRAISLPR